MFLPSAPLTNCASALAQSTQQVDVTNAGRAKTIVRGDAPRPGNGKFVARKNHRPHADRDLALSLEVQYVLPGGLGLGFGAGQVRHPVKAAERVSGDGA